MLTGCTGFIGKVLLEKILRSIPGSGFIFLLCRKRKNMTGRDRVKEILESRCFDRVRDTMGETEFYKWALEKIIPIQGDLTIERLGMPEEERARIINDCHVIINSAASTKFNDPLHDALNINYFGSMRMLELAK